MPRTTEDAAANEAKVTVGTTGTITSKTKVAMFALPLLHHMGRQFSVLLACFQRDTDRERDEEGRGCESSSCFGLEKKRFTERKEDFVYVVLIYYL